jgi:hypothetical protein
MLATDLGAKKERRILHMAQCYEKPWGICIKNWKAGAADSNRWCLAEMLILFYISANE